MPDMKNVFISHVHEDDDLVPMLKELIGKAGMEVRDGSITSDQPNEAQSEEYIQNEILEPRIQWASTLVVLITHDTAESWWVNWEIKRAVELDKNVIGVYAQGATDADIRSEEHTSELQSRLHLVCRLLLEKKKIKQYDVFCFEQQDETRE